MGDKHETTITDIFELSKNMATVKSAGAEAREQVREAMSTIGKIAFDSGDPDAMEAWTTIYAYFKLMNNITDDMLKIFEKALQDEEDRIIREGE